MSIRILLADDHTMMREGLRSIIEQEIGMTVVGQASNGREAVALTDELQPDIIIMDVHMPLMNGIDATREILSRYANIKIVALSMYRDKNFISDMFKAGAHAYVLKHCAIEELQHAISHVLNGRKYLSADLTGIFIDDYVRHLNEDRTAETDELTPKERNVLQLIAEGKSTKDIANILCVSVSTIESHRQHIMEKTGLHSVAELTRYAITIGLTEL